jgi:MFS family permease
MQQHVPPHLLSRVYAYDALGSLVAIPVGQVLAGPAAGWLGIRPAVVLCAVVLMVAGLAATASPAVRRLERTDLGEREVERDPATARAG